jgi:cytoskeletal protein CcmA (bactofilin family)
VNDTELTNKPYDEDDTTSTDSQVIPFNQLPDTLRHEPESRDDGPTVSVIGESLYFKGELSAGEDLIVEGTIEGKINQGKCCLTLKPNGRLLANVNATKIFIEGNVRGDLNATVSVSVLASADIEGNIVAPKVSIEEGATFNGNIEMRMPSETRKPK